MRVIYNRTNEGVKFSDMEEGTIFLYDGRPFMKVYGVTENTATENCFYAVDLTCGDLYDIFFTDEGEDRDDRFIAVEATLTIK